MAKSHTDVPVAANDAEQAYEATLHEIAKRMAEQLPCTIASIVAALRKSLSTDRETITITLTEAATKAAIESMKVEQSE